jgi:hypothetical protein
MNKERLNPRNVKFYGDVVCIGMELYCINNTNSNFIKGKKYVIRDIETSMNHIKVYVDGESLWCDYYIVDKNLEDSYDTDALLKTHFITFD